MSQMIEEVPEQEQTIKQDEWIVRVFAIKRAEDTKWGVAAYKGEREAFLAVTAAPELAKVVAAHMIGNSVTSLMLEANVDYPVDAAVVPFLEQVV